MENYEIIETIGSGSYANVLKAKELSSGDIVAIKKLKKKYSSWQDCLDLREIKSLNKLKNCHNIIKLKEMIRVDDNLHLIFEYMDKNLYELISQRQNKKLNENQIRSILFQTLQGIHYMHKYGFFHRDLKPENLLVKGDIIKIADFGLAREIRSIPPYTDYVSTRWYRAPECILKSTNYNSPIDIWALGCIMIELYNFKPIFYGNSEKEVLNRITAILGTPQAWSEGIQLAKKIDIRFPQSNGINMAQIVPDASIEALDMLNQMLQWDPNKRITTGILLSHPFFTKYPISEKINTPINSNIIIKNKFDNSINKDLSRILDDSLGLSQFINKLKSEGIQYDDNSYISSSLPTIENNIINDEIDEMDDIFKSQIFYNKSIEELNNSLYKNTIQKEDEKIHNLLEENKDIEGAVKLNKEEIDFENCKIKKNTVNIEGVQRSAFRYINGILKENSYSNQNKDILFDDKPIEFESRRKKHQEINSKKSPWDNKFEDYLSSNNIHIESRRNKKQIL